jgi:hypothetical protein
MRTSARKDQTAADRTESPSSATPAAMDGPTSSSLTWAQEIMNRAPNVVAQRLSESRLNLSPRLRPQAELQERLNRGASGVVQAMRIEGLDLETDDVNDTALISALTNNWSSLRGLTVKLSQPEAEYLYERLKASSLNPDIIEALEDRAKPESGSDDGEEEEEKEEKEDFDFDLGPSASNRPAVDKVAMAREVLTKLREQGGLPVFLSGGGAVTLAGGRRAIKDLDLRIALPPDRTFAEADPLSTGLIEGINSILEANFKEVDPLERSDPETGFTISGKVDDVEVSITRTPFVENLTIGADPEGIERLGEFDLILDKAYSFVMRSNFEKKVTDLIDILSLIKQQPGRVKIFHGLNQLRGAAFASQSAKANQRSKKPVFGDNLLDELYISLETLLAKGQQVKMLMEQDGAGDLYPLASWLLEQLGAIPEEASVEIL